MFEPASSNTTRKAVRELAPSAEPLLNPKWPSQSDGRRSPPTTNRRARSSRCHRHSAADHVGTDENSDARPLRWTTVPPTGQGTHIV